MRVARASDVVGSTVRVEVVIPNSLWVYCCEVAKAKGVEAQSVLEDMISGLGHSSVSCSACGQSIREGIVTVSDQHGIRHVVGSPECRR